MSWSLPRKLLVAVALLVGAAFAHAAPAAGVVITNTAQATYLDLGTGLPAHLTSNTVSTRVTALEALTLTANQSVLLGAGAPFVLTHTLTNTGNTASTFKLAASVAGASGFAPLNLQFVQDVNGNGRVDPGEPVIAAAGMDLVAGASANLLLTGQAPTAATPGQAAQVLVSATSALQNVEASNTDTLTVTSGAAVQVVLSESGAAAPSATLDWALVAVNNGNATAAASAILVDGAASTGFVLRMTMPANTAFVSATASSNSTARLLYHVAGAAANTYVSAAPASSTVDAVAWALPALPVGGSLQGQFRAKVSANASGTLSGIAYADWSDAAATQLLASNTVALGLPGRSAQIGFYTGSDYADAALENAPGTPLYVQADAAMCNVDAASADTVPIRVTSQLTGDVETFTGVETGANTGLFRVLPNVPSANAATHAVASGDGILEVLRNDVVTATISACGGGSGMASTTLLIDPSGVVYDSRSNQPVAGATVDLIDVIGAGNGGRPGQPASVLAVDGVTPAPASVVTGGDGSYSFPLVRPSTYQLRVTPAAGFVFPSLIPVQLQPAGRVVDVNGSFGGKFDAVRGAIRFDLPLDTGGTSALFVQKVASKATAEVGDFVDYTVTVRNVTRVALAGIQVTDLLPAGFAYVAGSARLAGAPAPDPAGGAGPQLVFTIGGIEGGADRVLRYRVRLGVGSQGGDGINSAQASTGAVVSNRASARVLVRGGVFSEAAYVVGKVFADCNRDGVQSDGEPGLPGVRVWLEDGTYAVTDEEGKYSFYGLTPRTHVAKVDLTTLPAGATLVPLDHRNAGDAASRFVDLKNGELHKANFAVAECGPGLREQIAARREALRNPAEIAQAAGVQLSTNPASTSDARTLPANGALGLPGAGQGNTAPSAAAPIAGMPSLGAVADTGGSVAALRQGLPQPIYRPADAVPARPASPIESAPAADPAAAQPLEGLLPQLKPEVGFVGLAEGQVMSGLQTRVRVKGPLGAEFQLRVNDKLVPTTQVGKKSSLPQVAVTAWEYIGVELQPGRNTLQVQVADGFGNVRGSAQVTVLAPGPLASLRIDAPVQPVADAATPVVVTVALRDAQGLPVTARTQVTLQASAGEWQVTDTDPHQPGIQVMVEGGAGRFVLLPPAQPGRVDLTVGSGVLKAAAAVEFVPNLRPMIVAGVVEGTLNLRNLNPAALQPAQSGDVFEREIRSASQGIDNGKGDVAARAALFLQGKVLGSSLLTLAYDSDKAADTRLFRDIQPNQFYPVYGDSSARGFDGQSTGKLYVLLQNGSNYALLGDFQTQSDNPARHLTQYARALNGAKGRWSNGAVGVEAFSSRTAATQVVQEIRANGTSGPFQLDLRGIANSEQVHVITRSREQPAVIVQDTALAAFTDYVLEPYTGRLLLKNPVSSVDADLNPVFIRVSYDVLAGGPEHQVAGVEATVQVLPGTTVGVVGVRDDDPANRQTLQGLTLTSRLGERTALTAEAARSETDLQGEGHAARVEFKHEGAQVQARAWGVHTDSGFYNPGSAQSAGQSEYGANVGYNIDASNRLVGEALKTSNSTTGAEQAGAELRLEHSLPGNAKLEAGMRYSSTNAQAALSTVAAPGASSITTTPPLATAAPRTASNQQVDTTTARVKLTVPVPGVPQADVYGLAEQAVDGSGGREIGIGGNYAVNAGTKVYLRHDFINSLNGAYTLTPEVSRYTTVAGVTTALPDDTQVFNEYRIGDAIDGRTAEAALGLRKTVRLPNGLNVTGALQRIKPVSGPATDDSTAIAVGAEYTQAAHWKASSQLQWQASTTSRSWLASGVLVNKLDADWTLLNRVLYNDQVAVGSAGSDHLLVTAQSGLAWRPVQDDRINGLARIEYKRDHDTAIVQGTDESAWILSTHLSVQPRRDWLVNARYAAKWASDRANGVASESFTQLFGARTTWDIGPNWDAGLQAYAMWGNGATESAVGVEVGYMAWKNLWISVGYNLKGFSARDLAGDAHTMKGAYLRVRYKFDETLLDAGSEAAGGAPATANVTAAAR